RRGFTEPAPFGRPLHGSGALVAAQPRGQLRPGERTKDSAGDRRVENSQGPRSPTQDGSDAALRGLGAQIDLAAAVRAAARRGKQGLVGVQIGADGGGGLVEAVIDARVVVELAQGAIEETGEVEQLAAGDRAETAAQEQAPLPGGRSHVL